MGESADFVTPKELAAHLGMTESGLRGWRARGVGPKWVILAPKVVRYRRADVEEWIRAKTEEET
nr:helix-turn-helix domain-containing protein [Flexivirga meconopsidis]